MRKYSFVYRRLVPEGRPDLVGLLAYSIYKNQKIEFIERYKLTNAGQDPPEDELVKFHEPTSSDSQIEQYNRTAESELEQFLNLVLDQKSTEIEGFYRESFRGIAKESGHGFMYGVWQGVVASLLYTALLGLLAFLLWSSQIGPKQIYERLNKVKIVPDTSDIQSQ